MLHNARDDLDCGDDTLRLNMATADEDF